MEVKVKQDQEAWNRGYNAGLNADELNPYPKNSTESLSWSSGYVEGEAKRKKVED